MISFAGSSDQFRCLSPVDAKKETNKWTKKQTRKRKNKTIFNKTTETQKIKKVR